MNKRIATLWKFLTYDIWRITEDEVTKTTFSLYNIIKTIYLCINRFTKDRLVNKASALTYSTLLAIVPILAIVFAIARGFGFDNLMESQIVKGFGGPSETTEVIFQFVNSYLSQTKSGIFIGVGLIMLLWTVLNLINNMEITFNRIWQVKKARSMYRKITDYFSMLLLIPILLVVSGGLSIFMSTMLKNVADFTLLAPIGKFLVRLIPFVLTWFMFTALYIFMPNTKVTSGLAVPLYQQPVVGIPLQCHLRQLCGAPHVSAVVANILDHLPLRSGTDVCRTEHTELQFR